ncbi:hypothetical protein JXA84_03800 [candidate division WOR-3 bacterium]|nr:hypothetical protein [candidate division WOR-3 bacterium]
MEEQVEQVSGFADRSVKINMQKLKESVDLFILESPNSSCPKSISDMDLPVALNPYDQSSPAYVDGVPCLKGTVGFVADSSGYKILGFGSNGIMEYEIVQEK